MKQSILVAWLAVLGLSAFADEAPITGVDSWGYRRALPAVVNPVARSPLQQVLSLRGERFFLNDKPLFLRGFGDGFVYPLTMVSPASKEEHLRQLRIAPAAGFNYVRLHTHCELPEYFEAADEAGIMIQPELPYYGDYPTEAFIFDPIRDATELYRHYRRYVSFTTYCTGNEGLLGKPLDKEIYRYVKRLDPYRLMIHQDGNYNDAGNSDFRNGPINVWQPGSFACDAPFVAHEYLNLGAKQDPRIADRFTGPWMPPVTPAARDGWLKGGGARPALGRRDSGRLARAAARLPETRRRGRPLRPRLRQLRLLDHRRYGEGRVLDRALRRRTSAARTPSGAARTNAPRSGMCATRRPKSTAPARSPCRPSDSRPANP